MENEMITELRHRMRRFYETSEIYKGFLDAHNASYLHTYIELVSKYSKPGSKILEVGGGNGLAARLLNQLEYHIISTDISLFFLKDTQEWNNEKLNYAVCDALDLPFKTGSFDVVCSSELIEHVLDAERALAEMARVVKKGGRIIIAGPNLCSPLLPFIDLLRMSVGGNGRPIWAETKQQAIKNIYINFTRSLKKRFASQPTFLYRKPDIEHQIIGGDADSVYYANPLDLERFFQNEGLKIIKLSVGFGFKGRLMAALCPRFSLYISMVVEKK
ncbi:class I SAM-dependent methyltransferase [Candidatus Poribacteria bacterium]|nr:class I SAM-dependent methyltransferase [Candidatus Poribacteria bacterium]